MSIVPKETIQVIAQSIGINSLPPDAVDALAPDVEYRVREIMQVYGSYVVPLIMSSIYKFFFFCINATYGPTKLLAYMVATLTANI